MFKRKIAAVAILSLISVVSFAKHHVPAPLLDKVSFELTARKWVNTQTALLQVTINATLTNTDLVTLRQDVMNQLNKIAKGKWQITEFNRSKDSSGLEKLVAEARARVDQNALTHVHRNAKSVSHPGVNFAVSAIEFKPSLEEVQQVKDQLRSTLYRQAKQEIERLNQVYSEQKFSLHNLVFIDGINVPHPKALQAREMMNSMVVASAPAVTVSNELTLTALIQAASVRAKENA